MTEPTKEYLTGNQIAQRLSIAAGTVIKWRKRGCPHYVLGPHTIRYVLEEVLAWKAK